MGMTKIIDIQTELLKHKPEDYPVEIVQNGTLPNEKHHVTNLGDLVQDVVKQDL
jgi:siroheme synthase